MKASGLNRQFILWTGLMALTLPLALSQNVPAERVHASTTVVLEVINRHFTVGKKIPSVYLRVLSDGTAECHTLRYWKEPDVVKSRKLPPRNFEDLKMLLANPEFPNLKSRYERMYPVVDSWMEWNIRIQHSGQKQKFEVSGFSPASARAKGQPYPEILTKLGCSIWKIRQEVYGDDDEVSKSGDALECQTALQNQ